MRINKFYKKASALLLAVVLFGAVSCTVEDHNLPVGASIKPKGPKPAFAPDMADEMWAVIEKMISYGDPPLPTLAPERARMNRTVKDAVMDLLAEIAQPHALVARIRLRKFRHDSPHGLVLIVIVFKLLQCRYQCIPTAFGDADGEHNEE